MKIKTIVFINSKLRIIISYLYVKIFKNLYLGYLSPLQLLEKNETLVLSDNDVMVETIICGYCGTDRSILSYNMSFGSSAFLDTSRHKDKKIYLGHEIVGKVVNFGKNVTNFSIGDNVILDSKIRDENLISKNKYGGWSSQFVRDHSQLIKIDPNLDYEKAILIEPLACSYGAIRKVNINKKDNILIFGAGVIGQGILILLRYLFKNNINISIATNSITHKDIIDKNLPDNIIFKEDIFSASKKILKTKVKTKYFNKILKNGYDIIFDCTGDSKIFNTLLRICNNKGAIILVGQNMNSCKIDPTPIWHKEISLFGSHAYDRSYPDLDNITFKYLEKLILNGDIKIDNLKINKINISNWKKLFRQDTNSIKNAIYFK